MIFILSIFIIIIIYKFDFAGLKGYHNDYLSMANTQALKGICALLVIFHHLSLMLPNIKILALFSNIGYLSVSIFFFISGYGLMYGLINKKDYLKGFLSKRLSSVLIPYFIVNLVYIFIRIILKQKLLLIDFSMSFINGHPFVDFSWYILDILFFYIVFYFLFKYFKIGTAIIFTIVITCLLVLFLNKINYGSWWYESCFVFVVGILWAWKFQTVNNFCKKQYYIKLILTCCMFYMAFLVFPITSKIFQSESALVPLLGNVLASILFTLCYLLFSMKLKVQNFVLNWIGKISLELYLIHGIVLSTLRTYIPNNNVLYITLTIVISLMIATVLHSISNITLKRYKNISETLVTTISKDL